MPEHYELSFTHRFYVGDFGDMMGLTLTLFVPAAEELRDLQATIFGGEGGGGGEITQWLDEVEADPGVPDSNDAPPGGAFRLLHRRHRLRRSSYEAEGAARASPLPATATQAQAVARRTAVGLDSQCRVALKGSAASVRWSSDAFRAVSWSLRT